MDIKFSLIGPCHAENDANGVGGRNSGGSRQLQKATNPGGRPSLLYNPSPRKSTADGLWVLQCVL